MSKNLPKHVNFKLNSKYEDQRIVAEYIADSDNKFGEKTRAIIKAIYSYLTSLHIRLDNANKKDKVIIEQLNRMDETLWSSWLRDMVYERLTGLDSRTGQAIPQQVQVVETQVVVTKEVVRVVRVDGSNAPEPESEDIETDTDLDSKGHSKTQQIGW